jgi:hypothetical protein
MELMRSQAPLLRALAAAGWEPVPQARVEPLSVRVERFGSDQTVYFVLHNPTPEAVQARLKVEAALPGPEKFRATLVPSDQVLEPVQGALPVALEPLGTSVVMLRREE